MKKYFLLRKCSDAEVIGARNGLSQAIIKKECFKNPDDYDELIKGLGSFDSPSRADFFYNPRMEIENIQLLKGAKLTRFLSFTPALLKCPFLISYDTYSIFTRFNIQSHTSYKANVKVGGCDYPYLLFYCRSLSKSLINYDETLFFKGNNIVGKTYIRFSSMEEERAHIENVGFNYNLEKIVFNSDQLIAQDLVITSYRDIYISEALKNELQNSGADGVEFLPAYEEGMNWPIISFS